MGWDMILTKDDERTVIGRNSYAIHVWFVLNSEIISSHDDIYILSSNKMRELKNICKEVSETRDTSLLPLLDGRWYDWIGNEMELYDYYWGDLKTIMKLDITDGWYMYQLCA